MRKFMMAGAVLAAALLAGSASAATNLIQNGGFADGNTPVPDGGAFETVGISSGYIPFWDVTAGTVDWIKGYWPSSDDDGYSIDLNGLSPGTIAQTINTVINQTYRLTFDISSNKDLVGLRAVIVGAGNQTLGTETYLYSGGPVVYDGRTLSFTANSALTQIRFESGTLDNCCWGASIDNVAVLAVPEPASWALMIMGFGAAGAVLRRRRAVVA